MDVFLDVGLTGGISCGKSTVLRLFATLDCFTIDADAIYHRLIERGGLIYNKLVAHFGERIVDGRQRIDRVALGEIVFGDPDALATLNAISHPIVVDEQEKLKAEIRAKHGGGIIITDAALMIEAGTYKRYDKIVVVTCDSELQLARLMRRGAIGEVVAGKRIEAQMPVAEKLRYADYVIHNNDSIEALKREVEDIYNYLFLDLKAKERGNV
jgi:dephospho-CoA kinase